MGEPPSRLTGQGTVRVVREAVGEALFVKADVSEAGEMEVLVEKTVEAYGRPDCAFNNAASGEGVASLTADFGEEEFDRVVSVNLKGDCARNTR